MTAVRFSGKLSDHVVSAVVKKIIDEGWEAGKKLLASTHAGQPVSVIPQRINLNDYYYTFEYGYFSCYFVDPSVQRVVRYRWVCYQYPQRVICRWETY
jgi:hypothetical protein